jgi:hypothetical protein
MEKTFARKLLDSIDLWERLHGASCEDSREKTGRCGPEKILELIKDQCEGEDKLDTQD